MAKRSKTVSAEPEGGDSGNASKAELIRAAAKELGKPFRPRDIVAALKAKGVTVGYTQISKALKAGGFRKRGRRRRAAGRIARRSANGASHSGKVNKAQRIRDVAKALGKKVRPKDIIAELAKEGIEVSSAQVSTTLTAAGYRRRHRARGAAGGGKHSTGKTTGRGLDLEALIATKALVQKLGGIESAEEALRALKRLA